MSGKKAFLLTLEALIAAVLGMVLLFAMLSKTIPSGEDLPSADVLSKLSYDDGFRTCALGNNISCVNSSVYALLPSLYKESFVVYLVKDAGFVPDDLPSDRRVFAESSFIAGNISYYNPVIVRLYYWS